MLPSYLLILQLYNGHGHGSLNGRGYPLVRYTVCNCVAWDSLFMLPEVEIVIAISPNTDYYYSLCPKSSTCNSSRNVVAIIYAKGGLLISTSSSSIGHCNLVLSTSSRAPSASSSRKGPYSLSIPEKTRKGGIIRLISVSVSTMISSISRGRCAPSFRP
jgi:hypothetical protein